MVYFVRIAAGIFITADLIKFSVNVQIVGATPVRVRFKALDRYFYFVLNMTLENNIEFIPLLSFKHDIRLTIMLKLFRVFICFILFSINYLFYSYNFVTATAKIK